MHDRGVDRFPYQRLGGTAHHRRVDVQERCDHERISRRRGQGRVAADRGDADYLGVPVRQDQRDGIVVAGIAIDDESRHGSSSGAVPTHPIMARGCCCEMGSS